jgi:predicted O-methyltransferase YrrM
VGRRTGRANAIAELVVVRRIKELGSLLKHIPGYRQLRTALRRRYKQYRSNPFLEFAPSGHFYSPLPDIQFLDRYQATLFDRQMKSIPGIENPVEDQLALVEKFSEYYGELPFRDAKSSGLRYYFENSYFCYGDAIILYSMLRHRRPQRIIEVGSGFSSAVMLDTNDLFFSKRMTLTFVEPYPERLFSLLSDEDKKQHEIIKGTVQSVPLERFTVLNANDILFIDSSHVAKIGSDVVHLLTNVLPRLNKGVIVHFHDVFWPFEYPEEWIRGGRAWNEDYVLKAFLQFNAKFKILFFNSYLAIHHKEVVERNLPSFLKNPGGSLWIEKIC